MAQEVKRTELSCESTFSKCSYNQGNDCRKSGTLFKTLAKNVYLYFRSGYFAFKFSCVGSRPS